MIENSDDAVRERAYAIWEREGRPDGQHESHWKQALVELGLLNPPELESQGQKSMPRKKMAIAAE